MADRIFVTGFGIISSIGLNTDESLSSLLSMKSGISDIELIDTIHKNKYPVGEIKLKNSELMSLLGNLSLREYSRTSLLGLIAARQALRMAGESPLDLRTGLISATTVGGMDKTENFYEIFNLDKTRARLKEIITHDCADSTEVIARETNINHYVSTVSSACSSSANSIIFGARLIRNGIVDRALVGGCDALTKFTINGFSSLLILDKDQCKPFDKNRMGLNLGEGAAFLVLESERTIKQRYDTVVCELKGWANRCDAFHQTASSPDGKGAYLAMEAALKNSKLNAQDIDYINAHGTGTPNNDLTEGIAIEKVFTNTIPYVSSTKPYTGHTLGAAGAVEAVISILALQSNSVFPNLNFKEKIEELNFFPQDKLLTNIELKNVLSNSFGFGGNCSSLIFSKI